MSTCFALVSTKLSPLCTSSNSDEFLYGVANKLAIVYPGSKLETVDVPRGCRLCHLLLSPSPLISPWMLSDEFK